MLRPVKKTLQKTKNLDYSVALVTSSYHHELTKSMETACREELIKLGVSEKNIHIFDTPGSWEIPLVVQYVASQKKYAGIAAFGVIFKGDTYHFEMIANECARALMSTSLQFQIPVAFEVLATYSLADAKKRALGKQNKGTEAAQALVSVLQTLSS